MAHKSHKTPREQKANRCVHFNGIQNETCKAGVSYDVFRNNRVAGKDWMPCLKDAGGDCVHCEKRLWPTPEEIEAELEADEKLMKKMLTGCAAVYEDAEKRGLRKGSGGTGEVPCPVCETGVIHYSVAGYNGHRHARCTTANCVCFME